MSYEVRGDVSCQGRHWYHPQAQDPGLGKDKVHPSYQPATCYALPRLSAKGLQSTLHPQTALGLARTPGNPPSKPVGPHATPLPHWLPEIFTG